jgi:hypothetical protein
MMKPGDNMRETAEASAGSKHRKPNIKLQPSSKFQVWCLGAWCLVFGASLLSAQPKNPNPPPVPLDPAEGESQARALVANLLAQKPAEDSTNSGIIHIRKQADIPARFEVVSTPTNYLTIYEVTPTNYQAAMRLTIIHSGDLPNRYLLSEVPTPAGPVRNPRELTGAQLMLPFAGSDFWPADLGLEFLHWPAQRVLRKEMRRDVFCAVLQSVNPHPVPGGYARVVSWIGATHPDETVLVHADAFDTGGQPLKQFDPKNLEKINGAYQLESMEMSNVRTRSRTVIEFNLKR